MADPVEPLSDYPPRGMEVRVIQRYAGLKGRRVLEIGSGDGRLTMQIAPLARRVVAIEPDADAIAAARQLAAAEGITNIDFRVGSVETVRLPAEPFEVVLFTWSL